MVKKIKPTMPAAVLVRHDRNNYHIQVKLPRVKKENIELEVFENAFCVKGITEDVELSSCYSLGHKVDISKAKAKFTDDLLDIVLPLQKPASGVKVSIE